MNTNAFYRATLRRAWQITSRHKKLWIFGLLAALLGNGGEYEFLLNQFGDISKNDWGVAGGLLSFFGASGQNAWLILTKLVQNLPTAAFVTLGIIVILAMVALWLAVIAQGALIKGVVEVEDEREVKLGSLFRAGQEQFWPLLAIVITSRFLAVFILAVIGAPLMALWLLLSGNATALGLTFLALVLAAPLFIIFSLIAKLAAAYQMTEGKGWRSSFVAALTLFANHWLVMIETALLLFIINLIVGLLFVAAIALIAVPFLLLAYFFVGQGQTILVALLAELGAALFVIFLVLFGSALATFQNSAWTILFLKIRRERHMPKLLRLVHGWQAKYGQ